MVCRWFLVCPKMETQFFVLLISLRHDGAKVCRSTVAENSWAAADVLTFRGTVHIVLVFRNVSAIYTRWDLDICSLIGPGHISLLFLLVLGFWYHLGYLWKAGSLARLLIPHMFLTTL